MNKINKQKGNRLMNLETNLTCVRGKGSNGCIKPRKKSQNRQQYGDCQKKGDQGR